MTMRASVSTKVRIKKLKKMPMYLSHSLITAYAKFSETREVMFAMPSKLKKVKIVAEKKFKEHSFYQGWNDFSDVFSVVENHYDAISVGVEVAKSKLLDGRQYMLTKLSTFTYFVLQ